MSLSGGIFIPLKKGKEVREIGSCANKSYKIGSSLYCDWVIENGGPPAVYCELLIDSFGRVTITNPSKDEEYPLKVNGAEITKATRLVNGQKIQILDEEYIWKFENPLNTHRALDEETLQGTPPKTDNLTEENAYSEPSLRRFSRFIGRLTMGSLKNWTNTQNVEQNESATESPVKSAEESDIINDISISECNSSPTGCKSPKKNNLEEVEKENHTPNKSYNIVLCGRSATVVTCYSPAVENNCGENYANVIAAIGTPGSVYSTPNKEYELGEFSTPNHSSMYLMDLTTTPKTKAPDTPTSSRRYSAVQGFTSSPIVLSDSDTSSEVVSAPSSSEPKSPEKISKKPNLPSVATPKRTPQSLIKRAILTSAKKAGHTPASRRSLLGISEKSHSIVRRVPQITPKMNKLTEDRLNLSIRNMQESKSPLFSNARKSLSVLRWTPEKKKTSPRKSMSATKATPEAIKAMSRKSMSAKCMTSRKSMFSSSTKSTPKPSISALRKSMVALSKAKTPTTVKKASLDDTCEMEGISELMKTPKAMERSRTFTVGKLETPKAMERSRTFTVDTPTDKVFNSSMSKNLMMAISPNHSMNVGSDVCADTLEEINTTVDLNSTIEISGIENDLMKDSIVNECDDPDPNEPEQENASVANKSLETNDPLILSAIKDAGNKSEISIAKLATPSTVTTDPLENSMSASMSGIGVLEDSNDSEMAENLIVSDNEEEEAFSKTPTFEELLKTPAAGQKEDLIGVKELLQTPKAPPKTPMLRGVREMFACKAETDSPDMRGIKETMQDPKEFSTPIFKGVKDLMRTPKVAASTPLLKGVKNLMQTPKEEPCSPILKGIKEMMNPEKDCSTPEMKGVKQLMTTPSSSTAIVKGVREMFKTPAQLPTIEDQSSPNLFEESLSNTESLKVTESVPEVILQLSTEEADIISANESLIFNDSDEKVKDDEELLLEGDESVDLHITPEDEERLLCSSSESESPRSFREDNSKILTDEQITGRKSLRVIEQTGEGIERKEEVEEKKNNGDEVSEIVEDGASEIVENDFSEIVEDEVSEIVENEVSEIVQDEVPKDQEIQSSPRRSIRRRSVTVNTPKTIEKSIKVTRQDTIDGSQEVKTDQESIVPEESSELDEYLSDKDQETENQEQEEDVTTQRRSIRRSSQMTSDTPRRKSIKPTDQEQVLEKTVNQEDDQEIEDDEVVPTQRRSIRRSSQMTTDTPRRKSIKPADQEKIDEDQEITEEDKSVEESPVENLADNVTDEVVPTPRRSIRRRSIQMTTDTPRRKSIKPVDQEKIDEDQEITEDGKSAEDQEITEEGKSAEDQEITEGKSAEESPVENLADNVTEQVLEKTVNQENYQEIEDEEVVPTPRRSIRRRSSQMTTDTPRRKSIKPVDQEKIDEHQEEESPVENLPDNVTEQVLEKTVNQEHEQEIKDDEVVPTPRRSIRRRSIQMTTDTPRRKSIKPVHQDKIDEDQEITEDGKSAEDQEITEGKSAEESPVENLPDNVTEQVLDKTVNQEDDQEIEDDEVNPTPRRSIRRRSSQMTTDTPRRKSIKPIDQEKIDEDQENNEEITQDSETEEHSEAMNDEKVLEITIDPIQTEEVIQPSPKCSIRRRSITTNTPGRKSLKPIEQERILEDQENSEEDRIKEFPETLKETSEEVVLPTPRRSVRRRSITIHQCCTTTPNTPRVGRKSLKVIDQEKIEEDQEIEASSEAVDDEKTLNREDNDENVLDEQNKDTEIADYEHLTNTTRDELNEGIVAQEDVCEEISIEVSEEFSMKVTEDVSEELSIEVKEKDPEEPSDEVPKESSMKVLEEVSEEPSDEVPEEDPEEPSMKLTEEHSDEVPEEDPEESSLKVLEEDSEEPSDEVPEQISEEVPEKVCEESSMKALEENSEESSMKVLEEESEEPSAEILEKVSEEHSDEVPGKVSEEPSDEVQEKVSKESSMNVLEVSYEIPEKVSENSSIEVPEDDNEEFSIEVSEESAIEVLEEDSEEPSDEVPEKASEEPLDEVSEKVSEEPLDEVLERVSEEPSYEVPEKVSEDSSTKVLDSEEPSIQVPEEVSEDISSQTQDDVSTPRRSFRRRSVTNSPLTLSKTPRRKSVKIVEVVPEEESTKDEEEISHEKDKTENYEVDSEDLETEKSLINSSQSTEDNIEKEGEPKTDGSTDNNQTVEENVLELNNTMSEVEKHLLEASVVFDIKTPKPRTFRNVNPEELNDTPNNMSIVFTPHQKPSRKRSTSESPSKRTADPARKLQKRGESTLVEEDESEEETPSQAEDLSDHLVVDSTKKDENDTSKEMEVLCLDSSNDEEEEEISNEVDSTETLEKSIKRKSSVEELNEVDSTNRDESVLQKIEVQVISSESNDSIGALPDQVDSTIDDVQENNKEVEVIDIDSTENEASDAEIPEDKNSSENVLDIDSSEDDLKHSDHDELLPEVDSTEVDSTEDRKTVVPTEVVEEADSTAVVSSESELEIDLFEGEDDQKTEVVSKNDNLTEVEELEAVDSTESGLKSLDQENSLEFIPENDEASTGNKTKEEESQNNSTQIILDDPSETGSDEKEFSENMEVVQNIDTQENEPETSCDADIFETEASVPEVLKPALPIISESSLTPRRSKRTKSFTDSPVPTRTPRRKAVKSIPEEEAQKAEADIILEDTEVTQSIHIVEESKIEEEEETTVNEENLVADFTVEEKEETSSQEEPEVEIEMVPEVLKPVLPISESSLTPTRSKRAKSFTDSPVPTRTPRRRDVESLEATPLENIDEAPSVQIEIEEEPETTNPEVEPAVEPTVLEDVEIKQSIVVEQQIEEGNQEQEAMVNVVPEVLKSVLSESSLTPRRSKRAKSFTDSPVPTRTPRRKAGKPIPEEEAQKTEDLAEIVIFEESEDVPSVDPDSEIVPKKQDIVIEEDTSKDTVFESKEECIIEEPVIESKEEIVVESQEELVEHDKAALENEQSLREESSVPQSSDQENPSHDESEAVVEEELGALFVIDSKDEDPEEQVPADDCEVISVSSGIPISRQISQQSTLIDEEFNYMSSEEGFTEEVNIEEPQKNIDDAVKDDEVISLSSQSSVTGGNTPAVNVLEEEQEVQEKLPEVSEENKDNSAQNLETKTIENVQEDTTQIEKTVEPSEVSEEQEVSVEIPAEKAQETEESSDQQESDELIEKPAIGNVADPIIELEENILSEIEIVAEKSAIAKEKTPSSRKTPSSQKKDEPKPSTSRTRKRLHEDNTEKVRSIPVHITGDMDEETVKALTPSRAIQQQVETPGTAERSRRVRKVPQKYIEIEDQLTPKRKAVSEKSKLALDHLSTPSSVTSEIVAVSNVKIQPEITKEELEVKKATKPVRRGRKVIEEAPVTDSDCSEKLNSKKVVFDLPPMTPTPVKSKEGVKTKNVPEIRIVESEVEKKSRRGKEIPNNKLESSPSPRITSRRKAVSDYPDEEIVNTIQIIDEPKLSNEPNTGRRVKKALVPETTIEGSLPKRGRKSTPEPESEGVAAKRARKKTPEPTTTIRGRRRNHVENEVVEQLPEHPKGRKKVQEDPELAPEKKVEVHAESTEEHSVPEETTSKSKGRGRKKVEVHEEPSVSEEPAEELSVPEETVSKPKGRGRKNVDVQEEPSVIEEPTEEPSVPEETTSKPKGRARKKVDVQEEPSVPEEPTEEPSVPEESISKPKGRARKKVDVHEEPSVPEEPTEEPSVPEETISKPKGRSRKKVEVHEEPSVSEEPTEEPSAPEETTSKPKGRSRKKVEVHEEQPTVSEEPSVPEETVSKPKGRGRKKVEVHEEPSVPEEPSVSHEPTEEPSVPEETTSKPKGRNRKKVEAHEEQPTVSEEPSVPEETVSKPKGRSRKKVEVHEETPSVSEELTEVLVESNKKPAKGRGRKKLEETPSIPEEPVPVEPSSVVVDSVTKPRGRVRKKIEEGTSTPVKIVEEKPKGRGRKKLQIQEEPEIPSVIEIPSSPEESSPKAKGRGHKQELEEEPKPKGRGRKKVEQESSQETVEEPVEESKPKGRGRKKVEEAEIVEEKPKGRGRKKAEAHEEAESSELPSVPEEKSSEPEQSSQSSAKPKGRGRKHEEEEPIVSKGRGRKKLEEPSIEVPEEPTKPKRAGRKNIELEVPSKRLRKNSHQIDEEVHEEEQVPEEETKPKRGGRKKVEEKPDEPEEETVVQSKPKGKGRKKLEEVPEEPTKPKRGGRKNIDLEVPSKRLRKNSHQEAIAEESEKPKRGRK
ncbi:hypothetical protein ACFFRR_000224 [Megaselia abdita]